MVRSWRHLLAGNRGAIPAETGRREHVREYEFVLRDHLDISNAFRYLECIEPSNRARAGQEEEQKLLVGDSAREYERGPSS